MNIKNNLLLLIVFLFVLFNVSSSGESRFYYNGILVVNIGAIPNDRAHLLIDIANQSTCDDNPLDIFRCNGIMQRGDRVVIGDNYIAFIDLTRQNIYGGGGGGLLRGLWLLDIDTSGNKNFKYIINGYNKTINLLYPTQNQSNIDSGDGLEILALPKDGIDPRNTYRASSSRIVDGITNGIYNSTRGWEHVYFKFTGILTAGYDDTTYKTNIGSIDYSELEYTIEYWFFNNNYPIFADNRNRSHQIQIKTTIKAKYGNTVPLDTLVFSLGLSHIGKFHNHVKMTKFIPRSHDMVFGNYPLNEYSLPIEYYRNIVYYFNEERSYHLDNPIFVSAILTPINNYFKAQYESDGDLQYIIDNSQVSSNVSSLIFKKMIFNHILYDVVNGVTTYDTKVGASWQADGSLGVLSPNNIVSHSFKLRLNAN